MHLDFAITILSGIYLLVGLKRGLISMGIAALASILWLIFGWIGGFWVAETIGAKDIGKTAIVIAVIVCALGFGEFIANFIASRIMCGLSKAVGNLGKILGGFLKLVNRLLGGALAVAITVGIVWAIVLPLRNIPWSQVSAEVNQSKIIAEVNRIIPALWQQQVQKQIGNLGRELLPVTPGVTDWLTGKPGATPADPGGTKAKAGGKSGLKVEQPALQTYEEIINKPVPNYIAEGSAHLVSSHMLLLTAESQKCGHGAQASAVAVAKHYAVTAAHAVAGMQRVEVMNEQGNVAKAQVVGFDPVNDLALLWVPELALDPVKLGKKRMQPGDIVVTHGFPGGEGYTVHGVRVIWDRIVSAPDIYDSKTSGRRILAFKGEAKRGESGGAVVNQQGELVGIIVMSVADDSGVGYATALDPVRWLMENMDSKRQSVSTQKCLK